MSNEDVILPDDLKESKVNIVSTSYSQLNWLCQALKLATSTGHVKINGYGTPVELQNVNYDFVYTSLFLYVMAAKTGVVKAKNVNASSLIDPTAFISRTIAEFLRSGVDKSTIIEMLSARRKNKMTEYLRFLQDRKTDPINNYIYLHDVQLSVDMDVYELLSLLFPNKIQKYHIASVFSPSDDLLIYENTSLSVSLLDGAISHITGSQTGKRYLHLESGKMKNKSSRCGNSLCPASVARTPVKKEEPKQIEKEKSSPRPKIFAKKKKEESDRDVSPVAPEPDEFTCEHRNDTFKIMTSGNPIILEIVLLLAKDTEPEKVEKREIKVENKKKRKAIPVGIRTAVWKRHSDNFSGRCWCCENEIKFEAWQCSHRVSAANGGPDTVENLYPCCIQCNTSMGSQNMDDFLKQYYPKRLEKIEKKKLWIG